MLITHKHLKHYLRFPVLLTFLLTSFSSLAIEPKPPQKYDDGIAGQSSDASPFLGFSDEITLWEDGIVRLTYNHAGARSDIVAEEIIADLQRAFTIIENIADIDFQFLGTSSADPFEFNDDIVTIGWQQIGGNTIARAGPASSAFNSTITRLGYLPAVDGSFVFNTLHDSDYEIGTMVHELMHLLGIGHSDTAISIMTPLTSRYNLPQADDIAVLQAMYGPPDVFSVEATSFSLGSGGTPGFSLDLSDSGLFVRSANASDPNALTPFQSVNNTFSSGDTFFLRLSYTGAQTNEPVQVFITDPNGFTSAENEITLSFANGSSTSSIGFASEFLALEGDWTVSIGVRGNLATQFGFSVGAELDSSNKNPTAALTATPTSNGQYSLSINASDPEGDAITIDWHIPGEGRFLNNGPTFNTSVSVSTPIRAFAAVRDNGIKKDGSSSGDGFGALLSQHLVTPAQDNIPTYFVQEQFLHIPSLLINGQSFGVNFELTALTGAQFKLLDIFASSNSQATSTIDLSTAVLTIPRIIILDNGATSEFQNLQFDLVPGSNPIKFALRL